MTTGLAVAWLALVTIVGLNAAAAGAAAFLHGRRKTVPHGMRALLASALAGFLPASAIAVFAIVGSSEAGTIDSPGIVLAAFAVCLGIATLVALPGALLVARRLEAPGDEYQAFE